MTMDTAELSVVIPAYREAGRIADCIRDVNAYFGKRELACEVIVADDGSDDATAEEVEKAAREGDSVRLVRLRAHAGKGAAARAGILASLGRRVLLIDADLAIPLSEFPAFSEAMDRGADIAIASKELGRRKGFVRLPPLRMVMGRVFNLLVRLTVLGGLLDTQAGFKLFDGAAARAIAQRCVIDGFAFDVETLAIARAEGLKIVELPVSCRLTAGTSVRVLHDSLAMLKDLLRIRRSLRDAASRGEGDA